VDGASGLFDCELWSTAIPNWLHNCDWHVGLRCFSCDQLCHRLHWQWHFHHLPDVGHVELRDWLHDSRLRHSYGVHGICDWQWLYDLRRHLFCNMSHWLLWYSIVNYLPIRWNLGCSVRLYDRELFFESFADGLHYCFGIFNLPIFQDYLLHHRLLRNWNGYRVPVEWFVERSIWMFHCQLWCSELNDWL